MNNWKINDSYFYSNCFLFSTTGAVSQTHQLLLLTLSTWQLQRPMLDIRTAEYPLICSFIVLSAQMLLTIPVSAQWSVTSMIQQVSFLFILSLIKLFWYNIKIVITAFYNLVKLFTTFSYLFIKFSSYFLLTKLQH